MAITKHPQMTDMKEPAKDFVIEGVIEGNPTTVRVHGIEVGETAAVVVKHGENRALDVLDDQLKLMRKSFVLKGAP